MKKMIQKLTASALLALMAISCVSFGALAAPIPTPQLPDSIIVDGIEFVKDKSSSGRGTALPDNSVALKSNNNMAFAAASYKVTGSDVTLYTNSNPHGHGPEQFASGWVQTTAPSFYARAEVRRNNSTIVSDSNRWNSGSNIANSTTTYCDHNSGNKANFFYGW